MVPWRGRVEYGNIVVTGGVSQAETQGSYVKLWCGARASNGTCHITELELSVTALQYIFHRAPHHSGQRTVAQRTGTHSTVKV